MHRDHVEKATQPRIFQILCSPQTPGTARTNVHSYNNHSSGKQCDHDNRRQWHACGVTSTSTSVSDGGCKDELRPPSPEVHGTRCERGRRWHMCARWLYEQEGDMERWADLTMLQQEVLQRMVGGRQGIPNGNDMCHMSREAQANGLPEA